MKHVVFAVVRCNPPTLGHLKLCRTVEELAKKLNCDYVLYTTKTHDAKKNPLGPIDKIDFLGKLIPEYEFNLTINPFHACRELASRGYDSATLVVGEDRNNQLVEQLSKYINHPDPQHDIGLKAVESFVIPRTPTDYSSSYARQLAVDGNFSEFQKQIPKSDLSVITNLYDMIRGKIG